MMKSPSRTTLIRAVAGIALATLPAGLAPALAASGTAQAPADVPPVLYADVPARLASATASYPMWMAADEVIGESGRVTDRLPEYLRETIQSLIETRVPGRCIEVTTYFDNDLYLKGGTLAEAIDNSVVVLTGTVSAKAYGFELDEPGQLFRIEPEEAYRGTVALEYYYFFVPVGHFQAGPYEFCKTDGRFPVVPELGDQVVLLVPEIRNPAEHYLRTSRQSSLVVLRQAEVVLPRYFADQGTAAATEDSEHFLAWVEQQAKREAQ
jgi:hypothetical protein